MRIALALSLILSAAPATADWTRIGPDGGDVAAVAAAPALPSRLYAAVESGNVFRSLDRGLTWTRAGWTNTRLSDLAVDLQDPDTLYVAGLRGLLKSTDGGTSWSQALWGNALDRITGVAVHPRTGAVFAFGARSLWRSTDHGLTWTTRRRWPQYVQALAFDPVRPGIFFAGTSSQGLLRSTNGGETWRPAVQGLPEGAKVGALAIHPRTPDTLWAGLSEGPGGVFKSTDGGATWTPGLHGLPGRPIQEILVDPERPSILYAIAAGQLFRSTDGGAGWTAAGSGLTAQLRNLEATPAGLLAATQAGVSLSTDRGLTWRDRQRGLTGLHVTNLVFDPQSLPRLYAGTNHPGIFKSLDGGGSWQLLRSFSDPLSAVRLLAVAPGDPDTIYSNADLTIVRSTNGGRRWEPYGGLVCAVPTALAVDPLHPETVYTSSGFSFAEGCSPEQENCKFARIDAEGESVCLEGNLIDPDWTTILAVDPFTSAVYAHNVGRIWRSDDRGATWTSLATIPNLVSFAASPRVEGTLYATQRGVVNRSRDGGRTWESFTAGLPADAWFVGMAFDPVDPDVLYAGILRDGVFRSTDGGATWSPVGTWFRRWTLRAGPVLDPDDPSILYAGTEEASVLRYEP